MVGFSIANSVKNFNTVSNFKCDLCSKGFKNGPHLERHRKVHSETDLKPFKCTKCSLSFREKYNLSCELGADFENDVCEQFGVWVEKSMYGKTYMGIQRATFVVDGTGHIATVWPKVKVDGHAAEVLEFVKAM